MVSVLGGLQSGPTMLCGYNIEQDRATWDDEATHRGSHRGPRCTGNPRIAYPGDRMYVAFNQGMCSSNAGHPVDLHVCSYCLRTAQRLWTHPDVTCNRKHIAKNRPWGNPPPPPSSGCQSHQPMRGQVAPQLSEYRPTHPTCFLNTATLQYRQRQQHGLW